MRVLLVLLVLVSHLLVAQPTQLVDYFAQIRQQQSVEIPVEVIDPKNAKDVLNNLPVYLKDSMTHVRSSAVSLARIIGIKSKLASVRQLSILLLIEGVKDKNTGNAGAAITYFTEYKLSNFTPRHKDSIRAIFRNKTFRTPQLIKTVGAFEMHELKNDIYEISQSRTEGKLERWSALLALARLGDETAVANIMSRLQKVEVNDDMIYQVVPDLVYTRSRQVLDYLVEIINSDAKNCYAASAKREENILCGYRVMERIAPAIKNYPLQLDKSGDVVTTDYEQALQTVRTWFKENKEYGILRDKF